jgi:putative DNA primase/helicase
MQAVIPQNSEPLPITLEAFDEAAGNAPTALARIKSEMLSLEPKSLIKLAEDYFSFAPTDGDGKQRKQSQSEALVVIVEFFKRWMDEEGFGARVLNGVPHLYSGTHWTLSEETALSALLGELALVLGYSAIESRFFLFREKLLKQFYSDFSGLVGNPPTSKVLINFSNGTLEIGGEREALRAFSKGDLLTYQLPFDYNEAAKRPLFDRYLARVLPDESSQKVLAEFFGWIFLKDLKLEKVLLLYGDGHNGKSVIFDIVNQLLGESNITNLGLSSLSKMENRFRLGSSLLNFGSEIKSNCDADLFKKMASCEPVEARRLYGDTYIMRDYARLAFNANILPKDTEQSGGFFRRFLIVPFTQTITADEKDPDLANKIIGSELPGVFNWVMDGLRRLQVARKFTECEAARLALDTYRKESDSVAMFLEDESFEKSEGRIGKDDFFKCYRAYCQEAGHHSLTKVNFGKRLKSVHRVEESKSMGCRFWHMGRTENTD